MQCCHKASICKKNTHYLSNKRRCVYICLKISILISQISGTFCNLPSKVFKNCLLAILILKDLNVRVGYYSINNPLSNRYFNKDYGVFSPLILKPCFRDTKTWYISSVSSEANTKQDETCNLWEGEGTVNDKGGGNRQRASGPRSRSGTYERGERSND